MTVRPEVLGLILACAAVTLVPRILPLLLARKFSLPPWFETWLGYVPVAVIGALLVDQVFLTGPADGFLFDPQRLVAGAVALGVGILTRSLGYSVVAGMVVFALAGHLW